MNEREESESIYRAPESDTRFTPEGDMLATYVGPKNATYYKRQFDRIRGGSAVSWHWPAFFVSGFWLLYRKMWLYAFLYWIVLPFVLGFVAGFVGATTESIALIGVIYYGSYGFITFILVPMYANRLYYGHAQAKVDKVASQTASAADQAAELERIGGTSVAGLIAALVLISVAMLGILAAIAIPAYQDYTIRAQVSEGLNLAGGPKAAVAEYYRTTGTFAADNAEAGLLPADSISGQYVTSVAVYDGAIVVTYGNEANYIIDGATLELVPEGTGDGSLDWQCASSDIALKHLPAICR